MKRNGNFQTAFQATLPVLVGYLVIGLGFGMYGKSEGFPFWWMMLESLLVYAGTSEFMAVGLLAGGASLSALAMSTLAVNARHLFYSISLVKSYNSLPSKLRWPAIHGITDETYSLVTNIPKDSNPEDYIRNVSLLDCLYWQVGTGLGIVAGNILPIDTTGIDFALTALFLTTVTDQWIHQKDHRPAITGILISLAFLIFIGKDQFLIPSMLVISGILLLLKDAKEEPLC